jgi:hypothetical protein
MKKKTFDSSDDESSNTNNDNDNDDEGEDDDEDELEILPKPPQYDDGEEEMDEWTRSKLLKAKKAKQGSQESLDTGDDDDDVELFDSNIETDNPTTNVNGSAIRKRMIIDDEDTNSVPDSELKAPPDISIGSSRKRSIAESSDDEESF